MTQKQHRASCKIQQFQKEYSLRDQRQCREEQSSDSNWLRRKEAFPFTSTGGDAAAVADWEEGTPYLMEALPWERGSYTGVL